MFHCPVEVWVIEQRAIIFSATVRSPTVLYSLYKIPPTQACFPLAQSNFHSGASFPAWNILQATNQ